MPENELHLELKAFRKDQLRLTQDALAKELNVQRSAYANWESGYSSIPEDKLTALRNLGFQADVSAPRNLAPGVEVPLRFIGSVAADTIANWTDPFESETFEFVPPEMADRRGRFCARVASDSMMDFLHVDDVAIFQSDEAHRVGRVVLYRTKDNKLAVKELRYRDGDYWLHSLNPRYEDCQANGQVVGYLVGIVRAWGTRRMSLYDPNGLTPEKF